MLVTEHTDLQESPLPFRQIVGGWGISWLTSCSFCGHIGEHTCELKRGNNTPPSRQVQSPNSFATLQQPPLLDTLCWRMRVFHQQIHAIWSHGCPRHIHTHHRFKAWQPPPQTRNQVTHWWWWYHRSQLWQYDEPNMPVLPAHSRIKSIPLQKSWNSSWQKSYSQVHELVWTAFSQIVRN